MIQEEIVRASRQIVPSHLSENPVFKQRFVNSFR